MEIKPSRFQWHKTKDWFHFYFLLGAIPVGTTIFLVNVFIGPATLEQIPEGYVPKEWEYHQVRHSPWQWNFSFLESSDIYMHQQPCVRHLWSFESRPWSTLIFLFQHPIKRFFQRYLFPSPQQEYEKFLHHIYHEDQVRQVRMLEHHVENAMAMHRDFRGPYFKEYYGSKYLYTYKKMMEELEETE